MSIFRTIAMFLYLFGYMIVHYNILRRGERALAAGDMDTVEQIVNKHIPHWSRQILHITGVQLLVEGLDNIPKDTACVFVGNHRSYYDIPLLLAGLDRPHGILAKEELEKKLYAISEKVYQVANEKISMSKMTFSHQMIRLIFVEQIYRAMTILNGGPYHHE